MNTKEPQQRNKRRRPRGAGSVYRIGGRGPWWISYRDAAGKRVAESSESKRKGDAERLLQRRTGAKAHNLPVIPHAERLTFDEAAKAVIDDFTANGKRSLVVVERRIEKHLRPYFGGHRLVGITAADVTAYVAHRQQQGIVRADVRIGDVSNAEVNRELQILKRVFSLAIKSGRIAMKPHIPMLREDNVRRGFFEPEQLAAVLKHLPTEVQPIIPFAAITGWRIADEVLPLEWHRVDFAAGEVRLDRSKNGSGRVFPMTSGLRRLLEIQHAEHLRLKKVGMIEPWVFWRMVAEGRGGAKKPKPITSFGKAWKKACAAAGCPGRIPHDLRRTAVRNLVRAGVPQTVAMKLTGHKTDSVFRRYDIVSPNDLRVAVERLDAVVPAILAQQAR